MRPMTTILSATLVLFGPLVRAQSVAPPDLPAHAYQLPRVTRDTLPNGLQIIVAESHHVPLVTIRLAVPAGSALDPPDQPGLAEAVADQLDAGTDKYNSLQLKQAGERLGGGVTVTANADYATISASALAENTGPLTSLIADVLLHPAFPTQELEIYKGLTIQGLTMRRQNPSFLAGEQMARALYGAHPYSVVAPTVAAVHALNRDRLLAFYRARYNPKGAVLVVVGDIRPADVLAQIRKALGGWSGSAPAPVVYPDPPTRSARRIYLLDRPGSVQSDIEVANLAVKRGDPDFYALLVTNMILGGDVGSRLFLNVRERLGYAYDAHSALTPRGLAGDLMETAQTRTAVSAPALKEMLDEEDALRTKPVTASELGEAKAFLGGTFVLGLTTQSGLADRLLSAAVYRLPLDYLETFRQRIDAVTADDVQRAAQKYVRPDLAAIVVVGDAAKVRESLKSIAEIEDVH